MRGDLATKLYAEIRLLSKEELEKRAGYKAGRQQLIASIIMKEVPRDRQSHA